MSSRTPRLLLAGLFSAAVAVFLIGPATAQEKPDLLKEATERQKLELQRVEAEFKDANSEATKESRDNPAKAIAILRTMLAKIETNADLPEKNRADMIRSLKLRISAFTDRVNDPTPIPNPVPTARAQEEKRKAEEAERLKQMLAEVDRLRRAGRTQEATVLAAKIASEYPGNPIARAEGIRNSTSGALAKSNDLKAEREQAILLVWNDVERSAMPPKGDIEFPRDWVEKSKKRQKLNITAEELKILKALNTPLDIDLKDSTLESVIDYLKAKTGVNIDVPRSILEEKAITYQTPVSVSLKGVTTRTILKKVLADVGLTYIVQKETIQVTTPERAKLTLSTKTYYIGDLISFTDQRMPLFLQQQQMMLIINDIIGTVVGTVEPQSWWINGGPGTIAFDPRTMSLIVRQTAEIHYMMGIGMR